MDPGHVDLHDLGNRVRVLGGQEPEERAHPLWEGLERQEPLIGRLDPALPPVRRPDPGRLDARGEPAGEDLIDEPVRGRTVRSRHEHDPHRPDGVGPVGRVRAHAAAVRATAPPVQSIVVTLRSRRRTMAPWAGTAEMFRIFWYSVSACQVETFRRSVPR